MTKSDRFRVKNLIGDLSNIKFVDKEGDTDTESVAIFKNLAKRLYIESISGAYNVKFKTSNAVVDIIVAMINKYFVIDWTEAKRIAINVRARKLACLLLKSYTTLSCREIGAFIMQKPADHTTVVWHIQTGSKLLASDSGFKFDFDVLTNMINEKLDLQEAA